MHKTFWVMTVLVGLVPPAVASQATAPIEIEDVLTMRIDGEVVVDSKGRLVSHTIKTKLPSGLRMALDKGMAAWEFAPPSKALRMLQYLFGSLWLRELCRQARSRFD